ncbi:MAG: thioredoxin domain-containing protein, partial [Acidobacteriota bacterium]
DGAEPSGNSVFILALLRLARLRNRDDFRKSAQRALTTFSGKMQNGGPSLPQMLVAQMFASGKPMEIVLAGPREQLDEMLQAIRKRFLPNAVVLMASESAQPMPAVNGLATAYVCENFACQLPGTTVAELEKLLQ